MPPKAKGEGDPFEGGAQVVRATTARGHESGETLGEDAASAARVGAEEPANTEVEGDRTATDGQIGDVSVVAAMDTPRLAMAQGARGGAPYGSRGERHLPAMYGDVIHA